MGHPEKIKSSNRMLIQGPTLPELERVTSERSFTDMRKGIVAIVLLAVAVLASPVILRGGNPGAQPAAAQAEKKVKTPSATILENWNDIGNKLVAMAEDWPEEKYTYRPNDGVRTFGQVLLHIAGNNYDLINRVTGKKFGNAENDPSAETFKTKAQIVDFVKKSVADGAAAIQAGGDTGALKNLEGWVGYIEHSGEHYGQLVVYYRNNNVVPPDSRKK
jgi:uncharacterized damage-inducible protein DinB